MRTPGHILVFLITLSVSISAFSSNRSDVYEAYLAQDMKRWKQVVDKMEQTTPKSLSFRLELLNFQYGYIGFLISEDKDAEAKKYLALADKNISVLEAKAYSPATLAAYRAALYGFQVALAPYKAPVLGAKSLSCCEKSMKLDPSEPMGYFQFGNALYFRPKIFGGSKTEAIKYFQMALKRMEANPATLAGNWNYLGLLVQLANSYHDTGNAELAAKYYEKAVRIEPRLKGGRKDGSMIQKRF